MIPPRRTFAGIILAALLLLLAFRLTALESMRENIGQKSARVAAMSQAGGPDSPVVIPLIGPGYITGYLAIAWMLAGAAAILARE